MLSVLSDRLDRRGRSRLCRRIEEHLRECPKCRMYVDTLRKTVVLYRGLGEERVPPSVEQRLFKTIRLADMAGEPVEGVARKPLKPGMKNSKLAAKRRKACLS